MERRIEKRIKPKTGEREKIEIPAKEPEDKGEFLIDKVFEGVNKKFPRTFSTQDRTGYKRISQRITDFKKSDPEKYKEFLNKAFMFSGDIGTPELEKLTSPEFFADVKKLLVLNELIEVDKLNPPPKLRPIIEKSFQDGKLANRGTIETLLGLNLQERDYRFIERALKYGNWGRISEVMRDRISETRSAIYETLVDDEKFRKFENSLKVLEKVFNRKIKIEFQPRDFSDILEVDAADKGKMEKLLLIKDRVGKLENSYNLPKISNLSDLRTIGDFPDKVFDKFLAKETKEKIGRVGEIHGLKKFETIDELKNWVFLGEENYRLLFSHDFIKQIESVAESIDSNKIDIVRYFGRRNVLEVPNFLDIESLMKNLSEKKLVFSQDVKEAKLEPELIFSEVSTNPSLWGRDRISGGVRNITDFATAGRQHPYIGWEYVAAGRVDKDEDNFQMILNYEIPSRFWAGNLGEPGFKEAKKRIDYLKGNLPRPLKNRLDKIFETLEDWRKEGKEIESEYGRLDIDAGSYVRFDDKLELDKSFNGRLALSEEKYKNLYDYLDRGFKSPSQISNLIGKGIETLYDFMTKRKEEYAREVRNLEYLRSPRRKELAPEEIKILEEKSKNILEPFEIMESIYKTPRGVYLSDPPLHGGARGEEPRPWDPRTYALRDNVFYKIEKERKENYVNVKEYHLAARGGDDLKIRLYSFSEKPDPKNLGEEGLSVEIERKGKTKFMNKEETENLLKDLKKYTLITLYLKDSPLLKTKEKG